MSWHSDATNYPLAPCQKCRRPGRGINTAWRGKEVDIKEERESTSSNTEMPPDGEGYKYHGGDGPRYRETARDTNTAEEMGQEAARRRGIQIPRRRISGTARRRGIQVLRRRWAYERKKKSCRWKTKRRTKVVWLKKIKRRTKKSCRKKK